MFVFSNLEDLQLSSTFTGGKKSMLLPKFDYHEPSTLEEALHLLSEFSGTQSAGGQDRPSGQNETQDRQACHVISIARARHGCHYSSDGHAVTMEAAATWRTCRP
jgi:CO/xanthine dehydrogenase FAD-binding subunit